MVNINKNVVASIVAEIFDQETLTIDDGMMISYLMNVQKKSMIDLLNEGFLIQFINIKKITTYIIFEHGEMFPIYSDWIKFIGQYTKDVDLFIQCIQIVNCFDLFDDSNGNELIENNETRKSKFVFMFLFTRNRHFHEFTLSARLNLIIDGAGQFASEELTKNLSNLCVGPIPLDDVNPMMEKIIYFNFIRPAFDIKCFGDEMPLRYATLFDIKYTECLYNLPDASPLVKRQRCSLYEEIFVSKKNIVE